MGQKNGGLPKPVIYKIEHCVSIEAPNRVRHHLRLRIDACAPACHTSGNTLDEVMTAFTKSSRKYLIATKIADVVLSDVPPWAPHDKMTAATKLSLLRSGQRQKGRNWSLFTSHARA